MKKLSKSIFNLTEVGGGSKGCDIWHSKLDKDGYPIKKVTWPHKFPKKAKWVRVQRLIVMIYLHVEELPQEIEISHLCHERACVKFDHLNIESRSINLQRIACCTTKKCKGHDNEPDCIL